MLKRPPSNNKPPSEHTIYFATRISTMLAHSNHTSLGQTVEKPYPEFLGIWKHSLTLHLHLDLPCGTASLTTTLNQSSQVHSPHCQTKPLPAPAAQYHTATNPLANPTQLITVTLASLIKSFPLSEAFSGQFLISSRLPHPYSGLHSFGGSFIYWVSFQIHHPATSEGLFH